MKGGLMVMRFRGLGMIRWLMILVIFHDFITMKMNADSEYH